MSIRAEFLARLGLDSSALHRGLAAVGPSVDRVGTTISRRFSGQNLFRGFMQGIGIGSVQQIADAITAPWKSAAESAKQIEESTARTTAMIERTLAARRTPEQNLAFNEKRQASEQKVLEGMQARLGKEAGGIWNKSLGVAGVESGEVSELRAQVQQQIELVQSLYSEGEAIRKQIADAAARDAKELAGLEKQLAEARVRRQIAEGDAQADLRFAGQRYAEATLTAGRALDGTKEKLEALRDVELRRAELAEATRRAEAEQQRVAAEKKADLEKQQRLQERIASITKRIADAELTVARTRRDAANTRADRLAFTLAEAAAGTRGNSAAQSRARQIERDEAAARRLRDSGLSLETRGQRGERIVQDSAFFENRALALRRGLGGLNSTERDPLAAAREAIIDSEKHLAEIKDELKNVQTARSE